jgi:phage gpG-like protein
VSLVDIEFKFPNFGPEVLEQNVTKIYDVIAATMQTQRAMIFDAEGAYNGRQKWAPLKFRNGQILSDKGVLRKSIGPMTDGLRPQRNPNSIVRYEMDMVTIGTDIAYARIHDQGGVIVPVHAKVLAFRLPGGKAATDTAKSIRKSNKLSGRDSPDFIFTKRVKIPQRQFSDITELDKTEIEETVTGMIAGILNGTA